MNGNGNAYLNGSNGGGMCDAYGNGGSNGTALSYPSHTLPVHNSAAAPLSYPMGGGGGQSNNPQLLGYPNVAQTAAVPTSNGYTNGHELHIKTEHLDDPQSLGQSPFLLHHHWLFTFNCSDMLLKAVCTAFTHAHSTLLRRERRQALKNEMLDSRIELEFQQMVRLCVPFRMHV